MAWNGFAKNDAIVLGKSIKENTTLKELDISHNRLEKEALGFLMQGVKDSDGLEILRVRAVIIVTSSHTIINDKKKNYLIKLIGKRYTKCSITQSAGGNCFVELYLIPTTTIKPSSCCYLCSSWEETASRQILPWSF